MAPDQGVFREWAHPNLSLSLGWTPKHTHTATTHSAHTPSSPKSPLTHSLPSLKSLSPPSTKPPGRRSLARLGLAPAAPAGTAACCSGSSTDPPRRSLSPWLARLGAVPPPPLLCGSLKSGPVLAPPTPPVNSVPGAARCAAPPPRSGPLLAEARPGARAHQPPGPGERRTDLSIDEDLF